MSRAFLCALALCRATHGLSVIAARPVAVTTRAAPIVADASRETLAPAATQTGVGAHTGVVTPTTGAPNPDPAQLDEGIYKLNKAIVDTVYKAICVLYDGNDYARFFVLETVARVPYFAYLSVMHLRETFGSRDPGDGDRMRTHYAEADNELHHLLIMESLGGNASIVDRTLAQSMAFGYYWYVIAVYSISEQAAYHLSELIEDHAYNTYNGYLEREGEKLKTLPVPAIARQYYEEQDPYLFDKFCTVKDGSDDFSRRRPKLESLYDVFMNVRDDEKEHWKTLCNLVQYDSMEGQGNEITSTEPTTVLASE